MHQKENSEEEMARRGIEMVKSDFGMGCGYCLGLFLAHADRYASDKKSYQAIEKAMKEKQPDYSVTSSAASIWFYGAADHLYEFSIPNVMSSKFIKRAKKFELFVMSRRLVMDGPMPTEKDVVWAIEEAKELLRLLDEEHGIKTKKAQWR